MLKIRILDFKLSPSQILIWASLIVVLIFNMPFILAVYEAVKPDSLSSWLFLSSVPLLLILITIVFLSVAGALFFPRIIISITLVVCALLFYATSVYGVIFDKSMIQNVVETNTAEALSYFNLSFLVFFLFIVIFPVFAVFNQDIRGGFSLRLKKLLTLNLTCLVGILIIAAVFYQNYASVGRNNRHLTKYIIPYAFYDALYKSLRERYLYPPMPFRLLDREPHINSDSTNDSSVLVVVVGETARASNFGLNGYERPTTPRLEKEKVVSFKHVTSCGTATAISVPCMFSRLSRAQYNDRMASSQDNVLDIISRAGVDVSWIDNNSSCKGVCERIETIEYNPNQDTLLCDGRYCLDEVLLKLLNDKIKKSSNRKVIVLHMIGSHGPTYFKRYPKSFRQFTPDCTRSDIQNCTKNELINSYDNTILYTDYVLQQVIEILKQQPNSSMLYISDHGESLGEKGLYLHGFPYQFAPNEQTHVPLIFWDSHFENKQTFICVQRLAEKAYSQDNLFDTLLNLAKVDSTVYQSEMDIFASCQI